VPILPHRLKDFSFLKSLPHGRGLKRAATYCMKSATCCTYKHKNQVFNYELRNFLYIAEAKFVGNPQLAQK
jgi:hypothetical protein